MKTILFILIILIPIQGLIAQSTEELYNAKYEANIKLEYINDVYIPVDVAEAMVQLDELSNEEGRKRMLEAPEELAAERLVFGLGKWMILHWNFFEGSRLSEHLKGFGVTFPDDMAKFLIVSYHRYLRQAPLELEKRGQAFFDARKQEQEIRNAQRSNPRTAKN